MPFKIYRSSAGSGKTFTLVKEYLRIILSSDRPDLYRGILAVTFTNKAAEETKGRVFDSLQRLSKADSNKDAMTLVLTQETGLSPAVLSQRASLTLKHMLHHYSDVSIFTFDRFSHRLIRTFAIDLGLSVNFEVELETEALTEAVLDALMKKVGTEPVLDAALIDLIRSNVDDEKSQNIDDRIRNFIQVLFTEESRFHLEHLRKIDLKDFGELRSRLKPKIAEAKMQLHAIGKQTLKLIESKQLSAQTMAGGSNGLFGFIEKLSLGKVELPTATATKNMADGKWYGSKAKPNEKQEIDALVPILTERFEESLKLINGIRYHEVVFNSIYGVALLDEMHQLLSTIQTENEILQIGEFNHLISSRVMTETAPFIYERSGARYHHFLIDEFQDTSILQWFNLLPLIDESLAHDNLCLVVGDGKQSIYRWRGGDVQQFMKLPHIHRPEHVAEKLNELPETDRLFIQREKTLMGATDIQALDTNYRSTSTVIGFNNDLFESLRPMMPEGLDKLYENCQQKAMNKEEGLVTVRMFRDEGDERSRKAYETKVLEQTRIWIDECLQDGFRPGDITILCRSNNEAFISADHLIGLGHKVVSSESLLINSSPKVRLLVNISIFLFEPENAVNRAELARQLWETNGRKEDLSVMLVRSGLDASYIRQLLSIGFPHLNLNELYQQDPMSLFSIWTHEVVGKETDAYVSFFLDEVLSFSQKKKRSLSDFIEHWLGKRHKLSIALEENDQAIRIMTIHKSKGLEFPVVIHPFADYAVSKRSDAIWAYMKDAELQPLDRLRIQTSDVLNNTPFEDDLNLEKSLSAMDMFNQLYVALTRAKDRLYVSGKLKKNPKEDNNPGSAIQFIRKHLLDSGAVNDEDDLFVTGKRSRKEREDRTISSLKLETNGNPYWKERIRIASPRSEADMTTGDASPRQVGIAIHDAMARIRTEADIEAAVNGLVESGRTVQLDSAQLRSHIQNLINRPALKHLYSQGITIRNETDIQLEDGTWLRPDRVVTEHNKAWVLDYKTGEERPEHRKQMDLYRTALTQLGFTEVKALLVYIESENVIEI